MNHLPLPIARLLADIQRWIIRQLSNPRLSHCYSREVCDLADRPYLRVLLYDDVTEVWLAYHPEIEDCYTHGDTPAEAMIMLDDARHLMVEHLLEHDFPVPEPQGDWNSVHKYICRNNLFEIEVIEHPS